MTGWEMAKLAKAASLAAAAAMLMTGCGETVGAELNAAERTTERESRAAAETNEPEMIDYPFPYDAEDWRLLLYTEEMPGDGSAYRFRVYDDTDNLVQDFPCGMEIGKLTFRFDSLYNQWAGLAVFPADAETSHANGLLYIWDNSAKVFEEEPIEIPWYERVNGDYTFLVTETDEQENIEASTIYCFNSNTRQPVELRRWTLVWDEDDGAKGELYIWDCLEKAEIYNGEVKLEFPGEPVNDEYYQDLFWKDLQRPWDWVTAADIPTAKITLGSEDDWDLENLEYESEEELLADCGFRDAEPFCQYYDRFGNLEMELYLDEGAGRGCGFYYSHGFNYQLDKIVWCKGFIFDGIRTGEWEDDTYSTLTWEGADVQNYADNPYIINEYTNEGELSYYEVRGVTELTRMKREAGIDSVNDSLLSIDWVYRDDGTLYRRYYSHDSMTFATTGMSQDTYYDELGRPVYHYEYITHGNLDEYYIYEGENITPKYSLSLDQDGGYSNPVMRVYK